MSVYEHEMMTVCVWHLICYMI